jgi:hypothetical protein
VQSKQIVTDKNKSNDFLKTLETNICFAHQLHARLPAAA